MAIKENVKPDVILKEFWRDNERFADLFNAVLFHGEQIIDPNDLVEADTDISSIVTFKEHAKTVQKLLDVVKKTAYGIDFVIWGLENQLRIHYAMPLRNMLGDSLGYLKEYSELVRKNKEAKNLCNPHEFLSGMKKGDRLHPMITICVYYGEDPWDGPVTLMDMLDVPEALKPLVSDYKMNLIQVRDSEAYHFHSKDVHTLFEITRNIYQDNYKKIDEIYGSRSISTELGLAIGAITESQRLINLALKRKDGKFQMCKALERLENNGRIEATIKTYHEFNATQEAAMKKIMTEYKLSEDEAWELVKKYWNE